MKCAFLALWELISRRNRGRCSYLGFLYLLFASAKSKYITVCQSVCGSRDLIT